MIGAGVGSEIGKSGVGMIAMEGAVLRVLSPSEVGSEVISEFELVR